MMRKDLIGLCVSCVKFCITKSHGVDVTKKLNTKERKREINGGEKLKKKKQKQKSRDAVGAQHALLGFFLFGLVKAHFQDLGLYARTSQAPVHGPKMQSKSEVDSALSTRLLRWGDVGSILPCGWSVERRVVEGALG